MNSPLDALSEAQISAAHRVWELANEGAVIHYAFDPYDIIDYCFPIHPGKAAGADISSISDDQVAWTEVFFVHHRYPILLNVYRKELTSVFTGMERDYRRIARESDLIRSWYAELDEQSLFDDESSETFEQIQKIVENNYSSLLAMAMALYKEEFDRFFFLDKIRIVHENCIIKPQDKDEIKSELNVVNDILISSINRLLKDRIYHQYTDRLIVTIRDGLQQERIKRTASADASAISQLLTVNAQLERAYKSGTLSRRHVILYLSSAPRTGTIFGFDVVQESLPLIGGRALDIHQTKDQVLLRLICGNAEHESNEVKAEVNNVWRDIEPVKNILRTTPGRLELSEWFMSHRNKYKNYNLWSSKRSALYSRLVRDGAPVGEKGERVLKGEHVIRVLARISEQADLLRDGREVQRSLFRFRTRLYETLLQSLPTLLEAMEGEADYLRAGRDVVTGIGHMLPPYLFLPSRRYVEVAEALLCLFRLPPQAATEVLTEALASVRSGARTFISADADISDLDIEHELVRNLFLLILPSPRADQIALDHAEEIRDVHQELDRRLVSSEEDWQAPLLSELALLSCWAARRAGEYQHAEEHATKLIESGVDDPRAFQARYLNTYAWHVAWEQGLEASPPVRSITQAIEDTQEALRSLKDFEHPLGWIQIGDERDVPATVLNAEAFLYCLKARHEKEKAGGDVGGALRAARGALVQLKVLAPVQTWAPGHPEFFHTEAYLEYQEALLLNEDPVDEEYTANRRSAAVLNKLEYARAAAQQAQQFNQRRTAYAELLIQITDLMKSLSGLAM